MCACQPNPTPALHDNLLGSSFTCACVLVCLCVYCAGGSQRPIVGVAPEGASSEYIRRFMDLKALPIFRPLQPAARGNSTIYIPLSAILLADDTLATCDKAVLAASSAKLHGIAVRHSTVGAGSAYRSTNLSSCIQQCLATSGP
jgi:hypothetical protein